MQNDRRYSVPKAVSIVASPCWQRALIASLACAALIAILGAAASAYEVKGLRRGLELISPAPGAIEEETSLILSWTADVRASEYVVFVSKSDLAGKSADELMADAAVTKKSIGRSSVRFQDVVRGDAGTTTYYWTVGARDKETNTIALATPSTVDVSKTFSNEMPASPLVREVNRGVVEAEPYADGTSVLFANGLRFDPVREAEPDLPANMTSQPLREGEVGSFLVQLTGPVRDGQREEIAATGATIIAYVPNYTFLVRMPEETRTAVRALPFVRWIGDYHPAYRVSAAPEMNDITGQRTLACLLFPDADMEAARADIEAMGATILEATDSGRNKFLRFSIDMARVADIATRNDVAWVEPWFERVTHNSSAQWVMQTFVLDNRRVWDMGITGAGQVVHTSDSGIRSSHNQFRDGAVAITTFGDFPTHRKIIAYQRAASATSGITFGDAAGASYHGTHTAGSLMGDDSPFAADLRDGNAKGAKIYFHDAGAAANTITAPGDLNIMFIEAYVGNAGGAARISSNSWGADNGGAYDLQQMSADQFMWDHKDFLHFFSNGNSGGANTIGTPAGNKNGVGAGGTANGAAATSIYAGTSRGPTDDGRRKPTICAPATVSSALGSGDTGYQSLTGTSMSSPTMAGATALIRQYLTGGWYPTGVAVPANGFNPSAALLKAMAINSTDFDMVGFTEPDNNVGWGRLKADNILFFPGDTRRLALVDDNDGLATGEFVEYEINVTDTSVPLKIALCWTDKEGNPLSAVQLVNNLDLTVTDPGSTVYLGNVFAAEQSNTGGSADSRNVEECVRRTVPAAGSWKVRVTAANAPFSPQPYALVISGGMGGNNGFVQLDKTAYGQDDVIEVRVIDNNASSPITVNVASTTEAGGENLSIPGANGVFVGTIPTTPVNDGNFVANGTVSVSHGDDITVTYNDANPVATIEATADVDFKGPVITNVQGGDGADESVTVTWTTDVLSTSQIHFGTTPALGSSTPFDSALTTSHSVTVSGLASETNYFFDVESKTHTGNPTRDDNGGAHYKFTSGKHGDILLVIGDGTFDKTDRYTAALDALGWDYSVINEGTIINPLVGDSNAGLRSYKAVWWQVGLEQYPPFENETRDSLTAYHDGGGRLCITSHDVAWTFTDPTSGYQSAARTTWFNNICHSTWQMDPLTWSSIVGVAADPISGGYTGGIAYTPHRDGAAGDEVNSIAGTGTANYVWRNNEASPDDIGVRWVNGVNNGTPGVGVWGGTPTRVVSNFLEWAHMTAVASRQDVLDKTLIWLIGRDHPDVVVTAPAPASVITTNTTNVTWTETTFGGTIVASRRIDYSSDGGSSWNLVTSSPGTSPYLWDVSALPNGDDYLVRVVITDNGTPSMSGGGTPDPGAVFAIDRTGGDTRGPVVVAGSIMSTPNPQDNTQPSTLMATIDDGDMGNSNVAAAEWSFGASPAAAGTGNPMTGAFGTPLVVVSATIDAGEVPAGDQTFWVRGQDDASSSPSKAAANNWGNATPIAIRVNGDTGGTGVGGSSSPTKFALEQNSPNPFNPITQIRYSLPKASSVELTVYNASGERVRTLVDGLETAGFKSVTWDGKNDAGKSVTSGVYVYRLNADDFEDMHKMVLVK
jgi:Subtilase family/FlgD Ig-like domain